MLASSKSSAAYYKFQRRTLGEFLSDLREYGWKATLADCPGVGADAHGSD